jgi:hypothetical protein
MEQSESGEQIALVDKSSEEPHGDHEVFVKAEAKACVMRAKLIFVSRPKKR